MLNLKPPELLRDSSGPVIISNIQTFVFILSVNYPDNCQRGHHEGKKKTLDIPITTIDCSVVCLRLHFLSVIVSPK